MRICSIGGRLLARRRSVHHFQFAISYTYALGTLEAVLFDTMIMITRFTNRTLTHASNFEWKQNVHSGPIFGTFGWTAKFANESFGLTNGTAGNVGNSITNQLFEFIVETTFALDFDQIVQRIVVQHFFVQQISRFKKQKGDQQISRSFARVNVVF